MASGALEVRWWDGRIVGRLVAPGPVYFEYDSQWLEQGYDLSPLSLPFVRGAQRKKDLFFNSLPGLLADCLPDSWGEAVMKQVFEQQKLGRVSPMKALGWIGSQCIGALSFRPEFPQGRLPRSWGASHMALLAREAHAVVRGEPADLFPHIAISGGAVGGARPKTLIAIDANETMVHGGDPSGLTGASFHLLKFDQSPAGDEARSEHAYALMAAAAGIHVAPTRLIHAQDPESASRQHLLVERFDVLPNAKRRHIHTLCGMLERSARQLDYADFLRTSLRLIASPDEQHAAAREIVRRMIFNVLALNDDDHGKNHAFMLMEEERDWRLTPAYDITYSPNEGVNERGLTVLGNGFVPSQKEMASLAEDMGIHLHGFSTLFHTVAASIDRWPEFAGQAGLNAEVTQRIARKFMDRRAELGGP